MSTLKTSELTGLLNKVLKEAGRLRKGNNLQYRCPFCHHRKRKLEVCLDEPNSWHCWVCDAKGRGFHSLFRKLRVPHSDLSALERIVGIRSARFFGPSFKDTIVNIINGTNIVIEETSLALPYDFRSLAYDDGTIEFKIAKRYAIKRKLSLCDIIKYNVGYCTKGPFSNRLVFPSYDSNNQLNFYSCRSWFDDHPYPYKNSEVSRNIIGFENLVDFDFPIYLCEGALDAIALRRNAIPLFGKTLSQKLRSAITVSQCPEVNIVLDDDALEGAIRIADFAQSLGKPVNLVRLKGKDPNVLGFVKTIEEVKNTKRLDFKSLIGFKLGL